VIPTIETERLVMRAFRDDDLDQLAAIYGDEEVMRYIGDGQPGNRMDTWRSMAMFLGHWQLRGYGIWAAEEKATGRLLGRIGMFNPEGWLGLEVGWLLARDVWGNGFATEGGRAALQWAFDALDAGHVISIIRPDNTASRRVAEKLGGVMEREIDDLRGLPIVVYGYDRPT